MMTLPVGKAPTQLSDTELEWLFNFANHKIRAINGELGEWLSDFAFTEMKRRATEDADIPLEFRILSFDPVAWSNQALGTALQASLNAELVARDAHPALSELLIEVNKTLAAAVSVRLAKCE